MRCSFAQARVLKHGIPWLALLSLLAMPLRGAETVQRLQYGTTLFHLYQQDYFNALTELMVAQSQNALGPHARGAELLRGGMALSWRMDREAERVFSAQLSDVSEDVDRERAWFYLARLAWRRGDYARAASALNKADLPPDHPLLEQAMHYRVGFALHAKNFSAAAEALNALPEESYWRAYALYNMGATLAADGQWAAAVEAFHRIEWSDQDEELRALRDRALTASGYAQLADGKFFEARSDFAQVRLEGLMAPRALLGHGWAALQAEDTLSALSPWQRLIKLPAANASVREALMAVPYAYEQLGRDGLALSHYREATEAFRNELEVVRRGIAVFSEAPLPEVLTVSQTTRGAITGWGNSDAWLPVSDEAPYLRSLIGSHAFQASVADFRDLQQLKHSLAAAQARLTVLHEADQEQQQNWQRIASDGGRDRLYQRYQALRQKTEALQQRLRAAERAKDGRELVSADNQALWRRLENAEQVAQELGRGDASEQLALFRGLLLWQDNEAFPDRLWQTRRSLAQLNAAQESTALALASLDRTIAARELTGHAAAITSLQQRTSAQQARLANALASSESALRRRAMAALETQEQQLEQALSQSQLAAAQLLETATAGLAP